MVAHTYSLSVTGYGAHNPNLSYKSLQIPDLAEGGQATTTPASIGGIMQDGDVLLCKNPQGMQRLHKFDAERSDPSRGIYYLLPI